MQKPDHNVVFLRKSVGEKKGQKLIGIRGIYQIRVSNMMEQQSIMHRNITCACVACVQSNYAFCQTNSTWTEKNLAEILTRQASINREQQFDQEAMETEERAANMYQMGSNLDKTWQARNESRRFLGQQRGIERIERIERMNLLK